eukprot:648264-Rhodomonas_salina.2
MSFIPCPPPPLALSAAPHTAGARRERLTLLRGPWWPPPAPPRQHRTARERGARSEREQGAEGGGYGALRAEGLVEVVERHLRAAPHLRARARCAERALTRAQGTQCEDWNEREGEEWWGEDLEGVGGLAIGEGLVEAREGPCNPHTRGLLPTIHLPCPHIACSSPFPDSHTTWRAPLSAPHIP